ncbi:MAG: ABC transporter permease, partial [candidate division Zixibacteria bacterium]|nr:ABC transporter permease [Gammaproteobacteria bacterium]NIX58784.1 ABC transporter permease [candidate division Zixibacteria bacterium]
MNSIKSFFADIKNYPSAMAGMVIIFLLISLAVYTVITIPYNEAIRLWRGGEGVWYNSPRY